MSYVRVDPTTYKQRWAICRVCFKDVWCWPDGTVMGHILPTTLDNTPCPGSKMAPKAATAAQPAAPKKRVRRNRGRNR